MSDLETEPLLKGNDRVIAEAKRRFQQCVTWESNARNLFQEDYKFANADCNNGYQWPDDIRQNRDVSNRPVLTINKTRQHNLQIINESKQNKPSVTIRPVGDGATYQSAIIYEGVVRHIEYISNAEVAYDTATEFQVAAGIGYWRVVTDYASPESFDQEIFIRRIKNPLNVYLDPDISEFDGSDARFGFIFDDMSKEEFNHAYPEYKGMASQTALGNSDGWITKDHVRVAEYYRMVDKKDKLVAFTDPVSGQQQLIRKSAIPKDILPVIADDPTYKERDVVDNQVEWFLIVGNEVVEKTLWPGRYIPIVRVIGEETVIDGILDRKGHTRALKDPQRMYNYFSSASVEFVALQSKIPFIAPAQSIEGLETYWDTANIENYSVLPYNHKDDDGNVLPPPQRALPPTRSDGLLQGMQTAQNEMMMASGQYEASFGQKSNETSGKAINERQRQGDTATYHYINNQGVAIRYTGKILIDLIPKIYDTPRVLRILAEDGTESTVQLDPQAQQAYMERLRQHTGDVERIFNPNVGQYDVIADVGPGYATKRQEAFNAYSQILAQNKELVNIVGDLLFKNADFPGADELAQRLERMVPPQAKGEGPPPGVQEMQQQMQQLQEINGKLMEALAEERSKLKAKDQQKEIDIYKARTDRMKVEGDIIAKHSVTPRLQAELMQGLAMQEYASQLELASAASAPDLIADADAEEPIPMTGI